MSQDLVQRRRQLERVHAEYEAAPVAASAANSLVSETSETVSAMRH